MGTHIKPWKDSIWISGLVLTILSLILFTIPDISLENESIWGFAMTNYFILIAFSILLIIKGAFSFRKKNFGIKLEYSAQFLILALISAFALNRQINIFHESVTYLQIYLTIMCITILGLPFKSYLPKNLAYAIPFLLGSSLLLCTYFAIFLAPYYLIGILGAILLGLSVHVFVPLFFVVFILIVFFRQFYSKSNTISFLAGLIIPLTVSIIFSIQWNSVNNEINRIYNRSIISENDLPNWVIVSQRVKPGWLTSKVISHNLLYVTNDNHFDLFKGPSFNSFEEAKVHDPMVFMATAFAGTNSLPENDRIKILESLYDMRHLSLERLWNGKDLQTDNIITDVLIYPELRISYTEKILSIANQKKAENSRWNQQEAIYTFYLSEGAVVSSLSLWIDGKEEKGILTTKAKADSAYKTIVGIESRDPSVVHWQEGNSVSVRIFPCTPLENRMFKIGITAPLEINDDKLVYNNIQFKGPSFNNCSELINLRFSNVPDKLIMPKGFSKSQNNTYERDAPYAPEWSLTFEKNPLKESVFSFANQTFTIRETKKTLVPFDADTIYLDLNKSWTKVEFDKVWDFTKKKKVYAGQDELVLLTEENKDDIFIGLNKLNYSLAPIYKIQNSNLLIISKSAQNSPNLRELKGSIFSEHLKEQLSKQKHIRLFSLSQELSPYIKTLKEFRALEIEKGSLNDLENLLSRKVFTSSGEDESTVNILTAGFDLTKSEGNVKGNAPDHLMRLYNYNDILKTIGKDYFSDNYINNTVLTKASQAYVVSPVSSLIVLETQKDYERFDIKNNGDSLDNASMKSSGAVPEPHEWALIIIALLTISYLLYNQYVRKKYVF